MDPLSPWEQHQAQQKAKSQQRKTVRKRLWTIALLFGGCVLMLFGLSKLYPDQSLLQPNLVHGLLLLVILGSSWLVAHNISFNQFFKMLGIWVVIFAGLGVVYVATGGVSENFMSAIDRAKPDLVGESLIVERQRDGHFWIKATINGAPIRLMIDTGASHIVLSPDDAETVGYDIETLRYDLKASTANGTVEFAHAKARSFQLGDITLFDVPVTINSTAMPGSLMGMSVLGQFNSVEFKGDIMVLTP